MNFLQIKSVLSIALAEIFTVILIPAQTYSQEVNPPIFNLNSEKTLFKDSKECNNDYPIDLPETSEDLKVLVIFSLGLGHHDNLTKSETWSGPEAKTANLSWKGYIEGGAVYKRVSGSLFGLFALPFPGSPTISGYEHSGGFGELGLMFNLRLLPLQSKLNINPMLGHKGLRESVRISDFDAKTPDSLNLGYGDNGMLFGLDFEFAFRRKIKSEYRIVLRYLHENLRRAADRYRVEWRYLEFGTDKDGMIHFDEFGYLSIGLEMTKWFDGRNEWFIIVSLGVEMK